MRERILVTTADMERLRQLIEHHEALIDKDAPYLNRLEEELDRAEVVEPDQIPPDVITMNSEVRLQDLETGEERVYHLVYPSQARGRANAVSVLAPIGTALLGYRAGDTIEWKVPRGIRRLRVLGVLCQPESAAVTAA